MIYNTTLKYLNEHNILYERQDVFRKGHSTYMALLQLIDEVHTATNDNKFALEIFFDLGEAFNTVNHDILLAKLKHYGFQGNTLKWFTNYMSEREQYVVVLSQI